MQPRASILCIDDDLTGLRVRKLLLESVGFTVMTATSGQEGVELFEQHEFDAVVLDYYMPGMDGGAVAVELKRLRRDTPIIMLSAYVALPDEVLAYVELFVQKGQQPEVLLRQIEQLLAASPNR